MSCTHSKTQSQALSPAERKIACQAMVAAWCREMLKERAPHVSVHAERQGWGNLQKGYSINGTALRIDGREYQDGLGTHADSEIIVRSEHNIIKMGAIVGFDQNEISLQAEVVKARLVFAVEVAGEELWRSEEMSVKSAGAPIDLVLPEGTREIVLKAYVSNGESLHGAHADWAASWVELSNRQRINLGETSYPDIPFSFIYQGKSSSELLPTWERTFTSRPEYENGVNLHEVVWKEPKTSLECRMELKEFTKYPALEWVVNFKNAGAQNTPVIENIQALDVTWTRSPGDFPDDGVVRVYRSSGSMVKDYDFEYREERLQVSDNLCMGAFGGRSSYHWLPFFNVDLNNKGIFTAIGWSGQWNCTMDHPTPEEFHICAGLEKTHLVLYPGEQIRTPSIAQLFWKDDRIAGHNTFRQFILNHHSPKHNDQPITAPFTVGHWGGMTTQSQLDRLSIYKREKLPQEYLWVDAGWFGLDSMYSPDEFLGDWGQHTGDWRVNRRAHPAGLNPISKAARAAGMKFMLWVEPGRATRGTHWAQEHPDWFLDAGPGMNLLLNIGDPEALQGSIELVSGLIRENDISVYREDFNIDPLPYWRNNDPQDRQGMTEIRCIEGLYKFWDALLERHPNLIIDNCASGGRRIDLETVSRSIALWRSDAQCFPDYSPDATQVHGMGLSYWLPLHGTGTWASMPTKATCDSYRVRSTMGPGFMLSTFMRETTPIQEDYPWDWFRKMCKDYLRARPLYTGDYYPLIEPVIPGLNQWAAYQMNRPDLGEGFIMAFRRQEAPWSEGVFKLHGIDADATYELEDADAKEPTLIKGHDLQRIKINLTTPESSALIFYKKLSTP